MTLENWAEAGKLHRHTTTTEEIVAIFGVAQRNLQDASIKGLSSDQKYILAYQAALEAAMALLYCHGFKPIKTGHHYITWGCLKEILPTTQHKEIALFENAAQKRNRLTYGIAGLASLKEADEMYNEAKDFVDFIKADVEKRFKMKI